MTAPGFHDQKKMVLLPSRHLYWQVQSRGEGLTEWHHRKIRDEFVKPESAIGVTLTSAYQLVPEASTSAIVLHYPAATYYLAKA